VDRQLVQIEPCRSDHFRKAFADARLGSLATVAQSLRYVRFGSLADIDEADPDVRF
jgi:hypothetical protein